MATVVSFKGKKIIEPGVYAQIKSGIPARPSNFSFGDLMIIDTGSNKGFGGGSGVSGEFANGLNSVYGFNDVDDFKDFVKGGLMFDLADYIFNPLNGASGPETVYIARAATTVPAEIEFIFAGVGGAGGGIMKLKCKNEGSVGNGYKDEIRAKATLRIDPTTITAIGDNIELVVNTLDVVASMNITSLSPSVIKAEFVDLINSTTDYNAEIQGGDIILIAPKGSGDTLNGISVELSTDIQFPAGYLSSLDGGENGTKVVEGYGAQMKVSPDDNTKFIVEFYQGSYNGYSPEGNHYGGLEPKQTKPVFIASSPEFDNIDTLIQWAKTDFALRKVFELDENWVINGDGSVVTADLTTYSDINLAKGGSENYNMADLDKLLTNIRELNNTFFLCDKYGEDARSPENQKIFNYMQNDSEFGKFMVVGGGLDETKFEGSSNSSIEVAKYYDDTKVIVVHSGIKEEIYNTGTFAKLPSIYHAANFAGRLGGLEPQTPATFKALKAKTFNHSLGIREREKALQAGVVHNRFVPGIGNVVNQAINTLQRNTQLINPDGTSFEISIMRIGAQLNKELTLNMRPLFVGNNRGVITAADVKSFVEGYLLSKTATDTEDNLIISFKNVSVRLVEDYYDIKYGFIPNGPINKLFVTGFMLDSNLF